MVERRGEIGTGAQETIPRFHGEVNQKKKGKKEVSDQKKFRHSTASLSAAFRFPLPTSLHLASAAWLSLREAWWTSSEARH
jgi:hypothetical protein